MDSESAHRVLREGVTVARWRLDAEISPPAIEVHLRVDGEDVAVAAVDDVRPFLRPLRTGDDALAYTKLLRRFEIPRDAVPGFGAATPDSSGLSPLFEERLAAFDVDPWPTITASGSGSVIVRPMVDLGPAGDRLIVLREDVAADGGYRWTEERVLAEGPEAYGLLMRTRLQNLAGLRIGLHQRSTCVRWSFGGTFLAEPLPDSSNLDPAEPAHAAFVQELFDRIPVGQLPSAGFVARVAELSPVASLRGEARLIMALREQALGHTEAAERLYVEGLRLVWGGRSRYERNALINFALMCLDHQRPLEAMLLSRRARALVSEGKAFARALSELHLAGALIELGDFERASGALARMDRTRAELVGRERAYIELAGSSFRITAAFHRADAASAGEARKALRRIEDSDFAGLDPRGVESLRGQAAFVNDDPSEAVISVQRRRDLDTCWDNIAADGDLLEVRSLLRLEQREMAIAAAEYLVERLESDEGVALAPGNRLELARRLGDALASDEELAELAARAFACAASAALERIWEADNFRRELPEFGWLVGDDRRVIDAYHERFVRDYDGVLDQVARLLTSRELLEGMSSVHVTRRLICVCAWCHRLRGPDGLWLDIGRFDPPGETVHLSHGACEPCCERVLASVGLGMDGDPR